MKCLLLFYSLTLFLCYILAQDDPGEIVHPVYITVRNDDYDPYLLLFALPLIGPILLSLLDGLTDGVNLILGQVAKGLGGGGDGPVPT